MSELTGPSKEVFRIVDANLNRIGEGLRVLEDIARLSLNDPGLSQELKDLRHATVQLDWRLQHKFIQARDATNDVGMDLEAPGQNDNRDLPATLVANARRVQEALRVIEELAKIPGVGLESETFKRARFSLYTIEKELMSRLVGD